jgi:hypothetical protein
MTYDMLLGEVMRRAAGKPRSGDGRYLRSALAPLLDRWPVITAS